MTTARASAVAARGRVRQSRIRLFDAVAAKAWNQASGHIPTAKAIARAELQSHGVGFIEWVMLAYYLLKIWKLLSAEGVASITPEEIGELQ